MSEVWVNDIDLADYGFVLGADPAHRAMPSFTDASMALLGAIGPTWAGEPVQVAPRRLTIAGSVRAASSSALLTAIDALKQIATQGAVRIRFADHADREFRDCRLVDFSAPSPAAVLSNLGANLSITFEDLDPLAYDLNQQGIPLSTGRAALPIGTAPSFPILVIHGGGASLSGITATYRDAVGVARQSMGFTLSLGANDYLIVDCLRARVIVSTAGVQADSLASWTSGDFFVIRSADGSSELGQYPTIELTGTGTPMGTIYYSRAWL